MKVWPRHAGQIELPCFTLRTTSAGPTSQPNVPEYVIVTAASEFGQPRHPASESACCGAMLPISPGTAPELPFQLHAPRVSIRCSLTVDSLTHPPTHPPPRQMNALGQRHRSRLRQCSSAAAVPAGPRVTATGPSTRPFGCPSAFTVSARRAPHALLCARSDPTPLC